MDCNLPGSSVHGILQARILQRVAMTFSRGSSRPRDQTCDSCTGRWVLYTGATWEAPQYKHFPGGSDGNASAYNVGDLGSTPGSGRSPGEGNGNPLQCFCLENPRDGGAWWAAVYGVAQSRQDLAAAAIPRNCSVNHRTPEGRLYYAE